MRDPKRNLYEEAAYGPKTSGDPKDLEKFFGVYKDKYPQHWLDSNFEKNNRLIYPSLKLCNLENVNLSNLTQEERNVILEGSRVVLSTSQLPNSIEGSNLWFLSDIIKYTEDINTKLYGLDKKIELHLLTCSEMTESNNVLSSQTIEWFRDNRLKPIDVNKQFAKDSIDIVRDDLAEIPLETHDLHEVINTIDTLCKECEYNEHRLQVGVDKSRCPKDSVHVKYNKGLKYYEEGNIIEPPCSLKCIPGYTHTMNSVLRGKCDRKIDTKDFVNREHIGGPIPVKIQCNLIPPFRNDTRWFSIGGSSGPAAGSQLAINTNRLSCGGDL